LVPSALVLAWLSLAVVGSGCDAVEGPGPPPPDTPPTELPTPDPSVRLVGPVPDLDVALTENARRLDLGVRFEGNEAAGPLEYSLTVLEGSGARVELDRTELSVYPVEEGTMRVRVQANGQGGGSAADTFRVAVFDPCPAAVGPDSTVVLPVEVGRRWTYELATTSNPTGGAAHRSTGEIDLEVVEAGVCLGGRQPFVLREQRTETVERRTNGGEWEVESGPTVTVRTYFWTVSATTVRSDAPGFSGRPGAGLEPAPFGREAPRAYPADLLDAAGEIQPPAPGPFGPWVRFRAGAGPILFSTTTLFGNSGSASETWTLRE